MVRRIGLLAAGLLAYAAVPAQATVFNYAAAMSGPNEFPANVSPGTGLATVAWDDVAHTATLHASFSGLTGTTTASHIHAPTSAAFFQTAGVATTTPTFSGFPLGVTAGVYDIVLDLTAASSYNPSYITANGGTTATAEAALKAAIDANKSYWNIHTSTFGGGEIRGFLVAVPGPASLSVLGLASLVLLRRRGR